MTFSPSQIQALLDIIDRNVLLFTVHHIGKEVLSDQQKAVLFAHGVDMQAISAASSNVTQAFAYGMLSNALNYRAANNLTFDQLKKKLTNGTIRFNAAEQAILDSLKLQTYNDVRRHANAMSSTVQDALVYADKANYTVKHSKVVTDAVKNNRTVTTIVSEIGKKTERWERDLGRIADFVLHTAFDEGRAAMIERKYGINALVYKDVYPGACKHCIKAYLTAGVGSQPVVFKLVDLRANATNVGRKVAELKPVLGPHHPWCRCTIMEPPAGFTLEGLESGEWRWNGMDFERDKTKWQRRVQRRSKIKVTTGGVTTEI